jgi:hypothetical protein
MKGKEGEERGRNDQMREFKIVTVLRDGAGPLRSE